MKLGIAGRLFPLMFSKVVYGYTAKAVPELNIGEFKKKQRKEYEAMVKRTPSVGSMKDNMFAPVMYLACYGFSYYKADPEHITLDVFDGMIDALCKSDMMKRYTSEARKGQKRENIRWTGSSIFPMTFRFRSIM